MSYEPSNKELLIAHLGQALEAAFKHLEYCNYGDKWEKECATASRLKPKIAGALEEWEKHKKRKKKSKDKTCTCHRGFGTILSCPIHNL